MIIGITGGICAGKRSLVEYLKRKYNFEAVDVRQIFVRKLRTIMQERKKEKKPKITKHRS